MWKCEVLRDLIDGGAPISTTDQEVQHQDIGMIALFSIDEDTVEVDGLFRRHSRSVFCDQIAPL